MKRVADAVEAKDLGKAEKELRLAHSKLDRMAKRKIWHRNNVARKKALLARKVARLKTAAASPAPAPAPSSPQR